MSRTRIDFALERFGFVGVPLTVPGYAEAHELVPQILGPPPPQLWPRGQSPHMTTSWQLSVSWPHLPWQGFGSELQVEASGAR